MKLLTDRQIGMLIRPATALRLAEKAFRAWGEKRVQMPPKVYLTLPTGDFRAMPAFIWAKNGQNRQGRAGGGAVPATGAAGVVGVKWISVYPQNVARGLAAVNGTLLLSDPANGRLRAVMEANVLTALRTGAAGALATRFLARPDASRLLLVGSGVQSIYQLACHATLKKWSAIRVWAPDFSQSKAFAARHRAPSGPRLEAVASLEEAVRASDVICTCTPSRKPLILDHWVTPGTHINAIGADAPGKQELEIPLLRRAKVVVDDWEQASHSGEINVAHTQKKLSKRHIAGDLGTLLVRGAKVRKNPSDITVFDSTGLAIQDMIMADHAYRMSANSKTK